MVEEKGIEAALGEDVPRQLEHLLGVNQIRIAVETSAVRAAFFFGYFQLANLGWKCPVIPDAVFAVKDPARRTFLVEYDRGTETLEKLLVKLQRYDGGLPGFPFEAVLIITERSRRLELLSRELRRKNLTIAALASTVDEVDTAGIFECNFVELPGGTRRKVLSQPTEETEG